MAPNATRPQGPSVDAEGVTFYLPDAKRALDGVRLWQDVRVPGDQLDFTWDDGVWSLRLGRPGVQRMEYMLELRHRGGGTQTMVDPLHDRRVGGAFGDHSVIEFPDYVPPWWLAPRTKVTRGRTSDHVTTSASLSGNVSWRLWSPSRLSDTTEAGLLLVHDGPEFDALAGITRYVGALVAARRIPPTRVALLAPGPRDDRYSANAAYSRALARAVIPDIRQAAPSTAVVGMGASLGGLSMLHLQRRHPDAVDGLFLQSSSFFHSRLDAHERRYPRFGRIERFVSETLRAEQGPRGVPVTITCGAIEENVDNNRLMARALGAQGYDVSFVEVPDVHNYTAWRDAFDPHLETLLSKVMPS